MIAQQRYWLSSPAKEMALIIAPLFIPVGFVIVFKDYFATHPEVTPIWWVALVVLVDVSHVYSTLFRFYWDRATFDRYKGLLLIIPALAFAAGFLLHFYDASLFWRVLAYAALYHFVRQQYGFMRLYARKQEQSTWQLRIDALVIYSATLYPVLFWHLHLTHSLGWFMPNDFLSFAFPFADILFASLYVIILVSYTVKEVILTIRSGSVNIPKNLLIAGTALSWYVGIVMFRGDLVFTLLNVVAHGIPYMGLIWIYGEKKAASRVTFTARAAVVFLIVLAVLAYAEEFAWDVLVWKDHPGIFPFFTSFSPVESHWLLSLVVPLLALPQVTHYVIDGFIWRFSKGA